MGLRIRSNENKNDKKENKCEKKKEGTNEIKKRDILKVLATYLGLIVSSPILAYKLLFLPLN